MTQTGGETVYRFFVDGKPYQTTQQFITGAEIRAQAGIAPRLRLFFGEQGQGHPDRQVMKDARVDLALPGEERFYTIEPPSMDIS